MAHAKQTKIRTERAVVEEIDCVILTLSKEEAAVLLRVVGNVRGDLGGQRRHVSKIYDAMRAAGLVTDYSLLVRGTIEVS